MLYSLKFSPFNSAVFTIKLIELGFKTKLRLKPTSKLYLGVAPKQQPCEAMPLKMFSFLLFKTALKQTVVM
jgi:hypothetical protein